MVWRRFWYTKHLRHMGLKWRHVHCPIWARKVRASSAQGSRTGEVLACKCDARTCGLFLQGLLVNSTYSVRARFAQGFEGAARKVRARWMKTPIIPSRARFAQGFVCVIFLTCVRSRFSSQNLEVAQGSRKVSLGAASDTAAPIKFIYMHIQSHSGL